MSRSIGDRHCLWRVGVGPEHPHLQPTGGVALVGAILAFFRCKPTSSVGLVASRQAIGIFFFRAVFFALACCPVLVTALANDGSKEPVGLIPSRVSGDRIRLGSLLRPQQRPADAEQQPLRSHRDLAVQSDLRSVTTLPRARNASQLPLAGPLRIRSHCSG